LSRRLATTFNQAPKRKSTFCSAWGKNTDVGGGRLGFVAMMRLGSRCIDPSGIANGCRKYVRTASRNHSQRSPLPVFPESASPTAFW